MLCRYAVCVFMYKDAIQLNVNRGKSDSIEMKSFTDFLLKFLHNKCLKGKATHTHTHIDIPHTLIHPYTQNMILFSASFLAILCMHINGVRARANTKIQRWRK